MNQNRRIVVFLVVTGIYFYVWFGWIQPKFFPVVPPQPPLQAADPGVEEIDDLAGEQNAEAGGGNAAASAVAVEQWKAPDNPAEEVVLGSADPASGYFQRVVLNSRGGTLDRLELNDARYKDLAARKNSLGLLTSLKNAPQTFASHSAALDNQLARFKTDSSEVNWKVERRIPDEKNAKITSGVIFSLAAPDGSLELVKTYRLQRVENSRSATVRDTDGKGYLIDFDFGVRNLSDQPRKVAYTLQGPVGMPLENEEHTSFFRNLELGFLASDGDVEASSISAQDVLEQAASVKTSRTARKKADAAHDRVQQLKARFAKLDAEAGAAPGDKKIADERVTVRNELATAETEAERLEEEASVAAKASEEWRTPFRYLGVEVQYFAALLLPKDSRPAAERFKSPRVAAAVPTLIAANTKAALSDISFELRTEPITVQPGKEVVQGWSLYAGPKRKSLLQPLDATEVLDQGRFLWMQNVGWVAGISNAMLWIMGHIHAVGVPYGIAIICLTVIVRGALFPLSRKQAIAAAKMKELQPKLNELKTKFGTDREGLARAQMELFSKHGYNPLGGCLPIFLQLPIFIGLYNALQSSVDLRMAEFLWINNLAAPDQLFRLGFNLPFIGHDFNLLPLITVVLFYIQQKLFMPPATTPEQEMQYKMMNFMMIFMGFFFYHVPAGLCVYFIASSSWSICERKLLANTKSAHIGPAEAAQVEREVRELTPKEKGGKGKTTLQEPGEKKKGIMQRLMEAADSARREAESGRGNTKLTNPKPNSPGGKPKHKSRP